MTGTPEAPGLIPRMIQSLFESLVSESQDFGVGCRYLEIYKEKVRDLLNPTTTRARNRLKSGG